MHHLTSPQLPSTGRHAAGMQLMVQMKRPADKTFALCWESQYLMNQVMNTVAKNA